MTRTLRLAEATSPLCRPPSVWPSRQLCPHRTWASRGDGVAAREDDQSCGVNRTDRLYALVEELRAVAPQWRSAKWFAERFEVSSRTIERDLSALQQAGVPIYATPGRRGGYAIDVQHTLPPLNLSAAEVAAVATALAADTATPFTHAGRTGTAEDPRRAG